MSWLVRSARLMPALLLCVALSAKSNGEALSAPQWNFSANFPCQSQIGGQTLDIPTGKLVMTTFTCALDKAAFFVAINDYPDGMMKPEVLDNAYSGGINGLATSIKGTIRSVTTYTLGGTTGREGFVEVASENTVYRARMFIVGNRLFQIMYLGPTGSEASETATKFLDSLVLLDVAKLKTSPPPK